MMGWKGTCTSLSVDEQLLLNSVNDMRFNLGNIMTDVVHQMHIHLVGGTTENLGKGFTG
jgi:hypothetical protein